MKSLTVFPIQTEVHLTDYRKNWLNEIQEKDALGESDCDCSSDCACSPADEFVPPNRKRLPFRNRDEILNLILIHAVRHTILDAPAGYGKTHLLNETKRRLESEQGYECVIVDICNDSGYSKSQDEILQEIAQGFEINLKGATDRGAAVVGALKRIEKFALMIDSIEADHDGHLVSWLRKSIAEPLAKAGKQNHQVILAGRHIQDTKNPYDWGNWRPLRREVLRSIRMNHIEEILKELNPNGAQNELRRTAEGMAWLSGGHPGIVESLVEEWSINSYGQDFTPETPYEQLKSIFERRVRKCVEKLLNSLGQEKAQLLRMISVFRQMGFPLLEKLCDRGVIVVDRDFHQIWTEILALNLFIKVGSYYVDGVIRQLIARNLEIIYPDDYQRYHVIALEIWENQLLKLASSQESVNPIDETINGLRNVLYHAINSGFTEEEIVRCICNNLLGIRQYFRNDVEELARLYEKANFDENNLFDDHDWLEYLEICHKPRPTAKEIRVHLLNVLSQDLMKQPSPILKPDGGNNLMEIKIESQLLDSLARTLDFLRQNAENVLKERWQKRNGRVATPPEFKYDYSGEVRQSLSSLPPASQSFTSPGGKVIWITNEHITSLRKTMENSQRSMDMFTEQLANPLPTTEKVQVQHQMSEFEGQYTTAASELADIFVYLYGR